MIRRIIKMEFATDKCRTNVLFDVLSIAFLIIYTFIFMLPVCKVNKELDLFFTEYDYAYTNNLQSSSTAFLDIIDGYLSFYVSEDKVFYSANNKSLFSIKNDDLQLVEKNSYYPRRLQKTDINNTGNYHIGSKKYILIDSKKISHLYEAQKDDLIEITDASSSVKIIPIENAMIFYEPGNSNGFNKEKKAIRILDENNELRDIFEFKGEYSYSTIAIDDKNLYISVQNFSDDYSYISENSGLYSVKLDDFSIEKLSSQFYCGLFLFGDGYIYAVDSDSSIYQLSTDGELVQNIYKVYRKWNFENKIRLEDLF